MAQADGLSGLITSWSPFTEWSAIIGLVFGGCCSNALTLEELTVRHPKIGVLVTFIQFLAVTLHGIRRFIVFSRGPHGLPIPSFRPRRVPLVAYAVQVVLHSTISLLNNAAFAYMVPMPVHIIFRSGGLVVGLILGWAMGKSYSRGQVIAVVLVTAGVVLTTSSALHEAKSSDVGPASGKSHLLTYMVGVAILTIALILSGFLGAVQDYTYGKYVRRPSRKPAMGEPATWEESMFYLHFLSLPTFLFFARDIATQAKVLIADQSHRPITIPPIFSAYNRNREKYLLSYDFSSAVLLLLFNALTQVFCAAGVNRLTMHVTSLTVTLVLVVRKAVSLLLSMVFFGQTTNMDIYALAMLWSGATLVFSGTVMYTISSSRQNVTTKAKVQ